MRIMQGNFLFLLIFVIILCIYPLCTTAEIKTFTHFEEKEDFLPKLPRMQRLKTYDDGTAVARIVRTKAAVPPKVCFFEVFSLRIIHLDGTVDEKEIDLENLFGIPQINYCFMILQDNSPVRFLDYHLIRKNQILITYVNTTNPDDFTTYEDWGMVIDFDGNEYDRTFFGLRFINMTTLQFMPNSDPRIVLNVNREKGFFRSYSVRGKPRQEWQQYKIEPNGKFTMLTSGVLPLYLNTLVGTLKNSYGTTIPTVDEGYAFVFGNTINNYIPTNPLLPQAQLSILPIGYNQTATSPLILYQNPLPNLDFPGLNCGFAFAGVGQTCILTVSQLDDVTGAITNSFFVKIDFLSSGSATDFTVISTLPTNELFKEWGVKSLQFGGFLFTNIVRPNPKIPNNDIYGYLNDGVNDNSFEWEFGEPAPGNSEGIHEVLSNNTLLVPQFEEGNSWQIKTIDLPKFAGDKDKGYNNLNVEATSPAINELISPNKPLSISINFYNSVIPSNGKLLIYQAIGDQKYLRQSIPSKKFSINNDGKTVNADVLDSTFSVSEGNYFIVMDNEFVKDAAYNEPLLGIRENVWMLMTERKKDIFAPRTNGLFRLTANGTKAFDNLPPVEQINFFNTLVDELSFAVPVDRKRLTTLKTTTQLDTSVKEKQYLISIGILEAEFEYDNSVESVINIIDTMVRNQDQSPIGFSRVAGYFDASHGFKQFPNLWDLYKTRLVGLFVVVIIFIILFFVARKRNREGNNMAIIQFGAIIFDLVMDILFVSTSARNIPVLYIPSVVFVTLPIVINTSLAFYIISKENGKSKFHKWFMKNGMVASAFTVLAGADLEALNILQSDLAGLSFFKAPLSESAKKKIFWGSFMNIYSEDIPQLVIQIYYRANSVTYDIIPLLTLISSSLNLIRNIVSRLYQATSYMRDRNVSSYNTPNDKVFNGSDTVLTVPDDKSDVDVEKEVNRSSTKLELDIDNT